MTEAYLMSLTAIALTVAFPSVIHTMTTPAPFTCPHSFVQLHGSCYKGVAEYATWPAALAFCEAFGAELAIISSQEEQKNVQNYLATLTAADYGDRDDRQYWIGAIDYQIEGDWKWAITQSQLTYTNWYPGNPDNGGDDDDYDEEHCAEMAEKHNWQWNDNGCEERKHFLCEMISL